MPRKANLANTMIACAVAGAIALLPSCSGDSPTGTLRTQQTIDPTGPPVFSLGTQSVEGVSDSRVEVRGSRLEVQPPSRVSFDLSLVNRSNTPLVAPLYFIITDVNPPTVQVFPPDSTDPGNVQPGPSRTEEFDGPDHLAVIDFSYFLGGDNTLDPGEESAPRTVYFDVPGLTAFSIGYRIQTRSQNTRGSISGIMFFDNDRDGEYDSTMEQGIAYRAVWLDPPSYPSGIPGQSVITDAMGRYRFDNLSAGIYKVVVSAKPDWVATTSNPLLVTLVEDPNGGVASFEAANFGFFDPNPPNPLQLFQDDVGPGVGITEVDTVFVNPPIDSITMEVALAPRYTLTVARPVFIRETPQYVDNAWVWINGTVVWEFACDRPPLLPGQDCAPDYWMRFELPDDLVSFGVNTIRIVVEGGAETFLFFAVERSTMSTAGP